MNDHNRGRPSAWRAALVLGALGLGSALLLGGLDRLTEDRIAAERREQTLGSVASMLSGASYDNALLEDTVKLEIDGLSGPATVYRARRDGRPVAAVFDVTTARGYSGDIRLLVAVDAAGAVTGVRILEHRETPGLGDRIERAKSAWLDQFEGKSLSEPPPAQWAPDRRGGDFDTLTSATITSAAVIDAIERVLRSFETRRQAVFGVAGDDKPSG